MTMNNFAGSSFDEEEETSYHVITTDNKYMAQLGLSTFTTGTLFKWWNDSNGTNRKFFYLSDPIHAPNNIFLKPSSSSDISGILLYDKTLEPPQYNSVTLLPSNSSTWEHKSEIDNLSYRFGSSHVGEIAFNSIWSEKIDFIKSSSSLQINVAAGGAAVSFGGGNPKLHSTEAIDNILDPNPFDMGITTIIEANNYISKKLNRSKGQIDDTWNDADKFLLALTSSIKISKSKVLEWRKTVKFVFNTNNAGSCTKSELVYFKLYLFDIFSTRNSRRTLAFRNSAIVDAPKSSTGQSEGKEIAAPPKASYDRVTGKWIYGSEMILARAKDIIKGTTKSINIESILNGKEDTIFENFGVGIAIPIISKNGDPRVWSAEFNNNAKCSEENRKPVELNVLNPHPDSIAKGELIYLIEMSGQWFTIRLSKEELFEQEEPPKWGFTYLSTSRDAYFRSTLRQGFLPVIDNFTQFTTSQYEAMFRSWYYGTDAAVVAGVDVPAVGIPPVGVLGGEYWQFTSFDFMDSNIGGLHPDGNTIKQTNFKYNVTGGPLDPKGDGTFAAGTQQFPFCGCVFPDGYDTKGKGDYFAGGNGIKLIKKGDSKFVLDSNNGVKKPFDSSVAKRNLNMLGSDGAVPLAPETDMFTGSIAGSELLHLPADIALNASPNGTYGSPIVNTRIIPTINATSATILRKQVGQYLANTEKNNYLLRIEAVDGSEEVSAFDLAPINSNIIQFRPLLFETFGAGNMPDVAPYKIACPTKGLVVEKGRSRIENGDVILSDEFFFRNRGNPPINRQPQTYGNTIGGCTSLQYGSTPIGAWNMGVFADGEWGSAPAQAVGIITASCTKTAFKRIQFDTTCFIGMTNTRLLQQPIIPTWGGSALINAFNTTCLFVRIFHSWPKEQTIFDPRFFAVFHFNDGIKEFKADGTRKDIVSPQYTNGVKDTPTNTDVLLQQNYPAGLYNVDDMMPGGFRVPTLHDKTTALGVFPIMSDSHLFRDKKHWNVDNREVGVLLPYTGERLTIGLATYFIKSAGFGYRVGDLFSVVGGSGTGSKWKVTGATAIVAGTAGGGQITGIDYDNSADAGRDYAPSDFISTADSASFGNLPPSKFKIKLVSDTLNKSALIYITQGKTYLINNTISGPKEIVKSTLISPLTPPEDEVSGKGIVSSPITAGVNLNASNRDPNNKYDIFFHFHNDISHTMANAVDFGSNIVSYQQFIETSMSFT